MQVTTLLQGWLKHTLLALQTEDPLVNRNILYQMVALYDYTTQGPEDLEFSEGDTIDILGEGEPWQVKLTPSCVSVVLWPEMFSLCCILSSAVPCFVSLF